MSLSETNAIDDPSGDHAAAGAKDPGASSRSGVRFTACDPSTSTTHRCAAFSGLRPCTSFKPYSCQNATRVPSRENVAPNCLGVGWDSGARMGAAVRAAAVGVREDDLAVPVESEQAGLRKAVRRRQVRGDRRTAAGEGQRENAGHEDQRDDREHRQLPDARHRGGPRTSREATFPGNDHDGRWRRPPTADERLVEVIGRAGARAVVSQLVSSRSNPSFVVMRDPLRQLPAGSGVGVERGTQRLPRPRET